MGFTQHYNHSTDLPQKKWDAFVKDVKFALVGSGKVIQLEDDNTSFPIIDKDQIIFNGIGEDSHETFYLTRKEQAYFCKTARKAYDKYVVAVLMLAKMHFGNSFEFCTEGNQEDMIEGQGLVQDQLNIKIELVLVNSSGSHLVTVNKI